MVHSRRNSGALRDPKLSIVIPVFNEKETIFEILRRVIDVSIRKEVLVVDDCSNDGTREILENLTELQNNGASQAQATDGGDPLELTDVRFLFQAKIRAKARRCAGASLS